MEGCRTLTVGVVTVLSVLGISGTAAANAFKVTRTDDPAPGTCTPASCSLREAVVAANSFMGLDKITLPAGTYTLTRGPLPTVTDDLEVDGANPTTTVITGGHATGPATGLRAGAVATSGANLSLSRVSVSGNSATSDNPTTHNVTEGAGGIVSDGGAVSLLDSNVSGNSLDVKVTTGAGGVASNGPVMLVNSTVSGNTATVGGTTLVGGVISNSTSAMTVTSSTISGNSVTLQTGVTSVAGGLLSNVTPLTLANSTVTGNSVGAGTATVRVGGVFSNVSDATLTHDTVADNSAAGASGYGNLFADGSNDLLRNTIIAGGSGPSGGNCDSGGWTSQGGNVETANDCGLDPILLGDQTNTDPQLSPLANNGGPTQTRAIPLTSPAVDSAVFSFCIATDQRGVMRPQGPRCDSGAFEAGPPVNVARPAISGVARVGLQITCRSGAWSGAPTFGFAWLRNGSAIAGAHAQKYRIAKRDAGQALQCRVTATNAAGSSSAESAPRPAAAACIVPNVIGAKLAKAKSRLARAHCKTGNVRRRFSATVKSGRVIRSKPGAGTNLPAGSTVTLDVARGPKV